MLLAFSDDLHSPGLPGLQLSLLLALRLFSSWIGFLMQDPTPVPSL